MSEYTDELDAIISYLKDIADELAKLRKTQERVADVLEAMDKHGIYAFPTP